MKSLAGKVVAITGAGGGMGREMAVLAAGRGARLALSDWDAEGLEATLALVRDLGAQVRGDVLDVSDRTAFAAWVEKVVEEFGGVNMAINNAGVSMSGDFSELSYEDLDWIVGINLYGVLHGTKEFLPHLIASGDGALVNISSLFGLISMPGQAAYNATKYAVRGLTEAIREEMLVARHPVTVTCVHPGGIKTGISRNGRKTSGQDAASLDDMFDTRLARTTATKAAEVIIDGALSGKARVLVGGDAHLLHAVGKVLGSRYQDLIALAAPRVMGRSKVSPGSSPRA
ncbi:SDR family NAD(P)-dependent oxidoreductase [Nocardioides gilvus]|uniref:SDR family NAD(P)-dependent oxidoreductase n=1 Tax=Nocardioides gilvus TaxID=1735589 RepID=UPI000D745880|nr:SDR family NAD(P)-dependent oxidoreductase [Nocardioides gilvus]